MADVLRDFEGKLWTQKEQWVEKGQPVDPAQWGITALDSVDKDGLSRTPGLIHTGSNSGFQAINLAYLMGAERIILIGYDMMVLGDQTHWFGDHPEEMNAASPYPSFVRMFRTIKPEDYGIEIWNCSRRTAVDAFPCYGLDECLASL